jgi:hypothetical protein
MKKIGFILLLTLLFQACKVKQDTNVISGYYNYDTDCVNQNRDGTILVKAWGQGVDQGQAELNARRNAIDDVLFKGFRTNCSITPIISNPNVKRDNKNFFDNFYSKNGDFLRFVSRPNTKRVERSELKEGKKAFEIQVIVKRNELLNYINNNIKI